MRIIRNPPQPRIRDTFAQSRFEAHHRIIQRMPAVQERDFPLAGRINGMNARTPHTHQIEVATISVGERIVSERLLPQRRKGKRHDESVARLNGKRRVVARNLIENAKRQRVFLSDVEGESFYNPSCGLHERMNSQPEKAVNLR